MNECNHIFDEYGLCFECGMEEEMKNITIDRAQVKLLAELIKGNKLVPAEMRELLPLLKQLEGVDK